MTVHEEARPIARWGRGVCVCVAALALVCGVRPVTAGAQAPASTVTIDVQVVDREGRPVAGLAADAFNVEVNGRRRRVLEARQLEGNGPEAAALEGRRVYFLAVDASTFGAGATRDALDMVTTFVRTLPEDSLVGLVSFPSGPAVEPTPDHEAVMTALQSLAGQRQAIRGGRFGLGPSEVMDYLAATDRVEIARRHCGAELSEDNACPQLLEQEANATVNVLEAQARATLGWLVDFATRLQEIPGRKVLVVASAGLPVAARSGARPDVGSLQTQLAEAVTRADVAFYTLLLDRLQDAEETGGRPSSNASADRETLGRWFDQFSASMGGGLMRVQAAQDLDAYARIARETTSFYQLTVDVPAADLADRPQRLRVRVDARGSTVRARTLVKGK